MVLEMFATGGMPSHLSRLSLNLPLLRLFSFQWFITFRWNSDVPNVSPLCLMRARDYNLHSSHTSYEMPN